MVLLTLNKLTDETRLHLSKVVKFVNVLIKSLCCPSVRLCAVQSHSCELLDQQTESNGSYTTLMTVEAIQHFICSYYFPTVNNKNIAGAETCDIAALIG